MAPVSSATTNTTPLPNVRDSLLPQHVDKLATIASHTRPWALIGRSANPSDGFRSISYAQLSNAVNRAAWWLEANLLAEKDAPCAYLGPNDIRYAILALATIKTRRKLLIPSVRNPLRAQLGLFVKTDCKTLLYGSSMSNFLSPLFAAMPPDYVCKLAPELDELLDDEAVPHYPYDATIESAKDQISWIFHTSGSSGNPKPIFYSTKNIMAFSSGHLLERSETLLWDTYFPGQKILSLLPMFHAGGAAMWMFAMMFDMTIVYSHPDTAPIAENITKLLQQDVITGMLAPPSILEDLSKSSGAVIQLAKLEHIGYGGGPLHPDVGSSLAPRMKHLFSFLGATENAWYHLVSGRSEQWDCIRFCSGIGYRFDEVTEGIFELVIVKDEKTDKFHGIFNTFPNITEYATRDLFSPAADFPGWMRYKGRRDDLIVLSNGEKINPIPLEAIIRKHPSIKAALCVGEFRFVPSLLVELEEKAYPKTPEERDALVETIWPTVQEANKIAPPFSQISRSLILFAPADRPFRRAGKGTIQRQLTVQDNSAELDALYSNAEVGIMLEGLTLANAHDTEAVRSAVQQIYLQALQMTEKDISNDDDVFSRGMDSLRVTVVVQRLKAIMRACSAPVNLDNINAQFIYAAPTIHEAAAKVNSLISQGQSSGSTTVLSSNVIERESIIEAMVAKYSANIHKPLASTPTTSNSAPSKRTQAIIITGTTGSLGSYILDSLLTIADTKSQSKRLKIYCINRTPSAEAEKRQKASNATRGLRSSWDSTVVEFLHADLGLPHLGLPEAKYAALLSETTAIIHSAWKVDFNLTLSSFVSQIAGVRNLLNFSAAAAAHPPLLFLSSISAVQNWAALHPGEAVPERVLKEASAPVKIGYGESKYIGERLLEAYGRASGVHNAVLRTGQIAGPVRGQAKGEWQRREWFPSLVTSSGYLGMLPETLGSMDEVDWVPVDVLAEIVLDLLDVMENSASTPTTQVYNLINPHAVPFSHLLPTIQTALSPPQIPNPSFAAKSQPSMNTVPLQTWVAALVASASAHHGFIIEQNPGVKILDFYQDLARGDKGEKDASVKATQQWQVDALVRDSPHAARLEAVSPAWMALWMKQWGY